MSNVRVVDRTVRHIKVKTPKVFASQTCFNVFTVKEEWNELLKTILAFDSQCWTWHQFQTWVTSWWKGAYAWCLINATLIKWTAVQYTEYMYNVYSVHLCLESNAVLPYVRKRAIHNTIKEIESVEYMWVLLLVICLFLCSSCLKTMSTILDLMGHLSYSVLTHYIF